MLFLAIALSAVVLGLVFRTRSGFRFRVGLVATFSVALSLGSAALSVSADSNKAARAPHGELTGHAAGTGASTALPVRRNVSDDLRWCG